MPPARRASSGLTVAVTDPRVLVFVRDEDAARYREDDVVGEAERRFGVPVTEVAG